MSLMSSRTKHFKSSIDLFNIRDSTCKPEISCSQYITMYYNFIRKYPLKFNSDFINEVGNCNLSDCNLPGER